MSSSRDGSPSDDDSDGNELDARQTESAGGSRAPSDALSDGGGREKETGPLALVRRFRNSDNEAIVFVREMLSSAALVLAIGLLLFAISGVWPPMVAIESGSMEPNMQKGDLVFIMEEGRLPPDASHADTGVVTYKAGQEAGYEKFNNPGDVIVYQPDGKDYEVPIIHRAMFWVEEGENWYGEADEQHLPPNTNSCGDISTCPANHSGFVTKGDANRFYDQSDGMGISGPVKPSWVRGTAEVRVPWLGWVRLKFSGAAYVHPWTAPSPATV